MRLPLFSGATYSPFEKTLLIALLVLAAVGALLTLKSISDTYSVTVPAHGGTYKEAVVGVPRFINPVLAVSDADRDVTELVFGGLMKESADGSMAPYLASTYSISEDGREYTFVLREDAHFSDGTKITSADVAMTIGLIQNPLVKSPKRANWEGVHVDAPDERTIIFTLKNAYAPFIENTTLGILPKSIWGNVSPEEFQFSTHNVNAIGAGPFAIKKVTTSNKGIPSRIALDVNPYAPIRPYLDSIELSFYSDESEVLAALQGNSSIAVHSVSSAPTSDRDLHEAILNRVFAVFYNQNHNDLFVDKAVRVALDTAIDKSALVSTIVGGFGSPLAGPLPPTSIDATEIASATSSKAEQARALLTQAGWKEGQNGILEKTVKKKTKQLSLTLATSNVPELKAAAEFVAAAWREVGAQVDVQLFDSSDLQQEVIRPRSYDALLFGEAVGRELDLYAFWHSSQRADPGLNIALYVNPAVDSLLTQARGENDESARRALLEKAAGIIVDDEAALFLYAPHFVFETPKQLKGVELGSITTVSDRFADIEKWYIRVDRVWPMFVK